MMLETGGILLQLLSRFFKHASPKYQITDRILKALPYIRKNIEHPIHINE
jgi:hypothetical protein